MLPLHYHTLFIGNPLGYLSWRRESNSRLQILQIRLSSDRQHKKTEALTLSYTRDLYFATFHYSLFSWFAVQVCPPVIAITFLGNL